MIFRHSCFAKCRSNTPLLSIRFVRSLYKSRSCTNSLFVDARGCHNPDAFSTSQRQYPVAEVAGTVCSRSMKCASPSLPLYRHFDAPDECCATEALCSYFACFVPSHATVQNFWQNMLRPPIVPHVLLVLVRVAVPMAMPVGVASVRSCLLDIFACPTAH